MIVKPLLPPVTPPIVTISPLTEGSGTADILWKIGAYIAIFIVYMLALCLVLKGIKKEMKIKTPIALLFGAGFGLAILLLFGTTLTAVKGLILTLILYYASLSDLGKREVPNYLSAMIVILAFVGFDAANLPSMLIGASVVFLPQYIISLVMKDKPNGGADIKLSTAAAFMLGAEKGIFALIVGLLAGVLTMLALRLFKKAKKGEPFPLVPFLSVGALFAFCL